jgi:hypothetical protein
MPVSSAGAMSAQTATSRRLESDIVALLDVREQRASP